VTKVTFCGLLIFIQFFLAIILAPIKGSKDLDDNLVSKKPLNEKCGSLAWHLGLENVDFC